MRKNTARPVLATILLVVLVLALGSHSQGNSATVSAAAMEETDWGFGTGGDPNRWAVYFNGSIEIGMTAILGDGIWPFQNGTSASCSYLLNGEVATAPFPVNVDDVIETVCDGIDGPDWGFLFVWHADASEFETPINGLVAEAAPTEVEIGQTVVLSATVETGTFMTYTWQVADEMIGTDNPISYTTIATGTHLVEITVANTINSETVTTTFEVTPPPPPFFEMTATPNTVEIGAPISLSIDTNMDLVAIVIDPRDGSEIQFGDIVTHVYGVGVYHPIAYGVIASGDMNATGQMLATVNLAALQNMIALGEVVTATTTITVTPHVFTVFCPVAFYNWSPPQPVTTTWSFSSNAAWAQWLGQTERRDSLEIGLTIVDGAFWPYLNAPSVINYTMTFNGNEVPSGYIPNGAGTFEIWPDWEPLGYTPTEPENGFEFHWTGSGWEVPTF